MFDQNEYARQWRLNHKDYIQAYRKATKQHRAYMDRRYAKKHSEQIKERRRSKYQAVRKLIDDLKSKPCMDCRGTFPVCAMQFDHRSRLEKAYNICNLTRYVNTDRLYQEIQKCDVVCANCHFIRTDTRRKNGTFGPHRIKKLSPPGIEPGYLASQASAFSVKPRGQK